MTPHMTPHERELRRALAARSGDPSPDLHARVSDAIEHALPLPHAMPALAMAAAAVLTITTVGVLLGVRHYLVSSGTPSPGGPASVGRVASPSASPSPSAPTSPSPSGPPLYLPTTADLSAPSTDVLWALIGNVKLFVSTDHGRTWQQRPLPATMVSEVSFVDQSEGWAMLSGPGGTQCQTGPVTVWHTTDAGATWRELVNVGLQARSGIDPAQCKENLSFVDSEHGYFDAWDDNGRPSIYRTSDGGVTWSTSTLPDPTGFKTQAGGDTLRPGVARAFGGVLLVSAYGMQPDGMHGYVFRSTDLGANWTPVANLPDVYDSVVFVTATRWLFVVPNGSTETADAGQSWHAYVSDYQQAAGVPPQLVFADPNLGYATVRGEIQRTDDGGAHWTGVQTPGVVPPG